MSVRAKRLRFAVIPDVITTDAESDIYFSKIERLVQFFRKYCSDGDKESVKVCFEKTSKRHLNDNLTAEEGKIGEIEKESEREKEKDKDKNRKKKVEVNLLKIWLGTKGDPKWAFLQCDRLAGDAKVMHVEVSEAFCSMVDWEKSSIS